MDPRPWGDKGGRGVKERAGLKGRRVRPRRLITPPLPETGSGGAGGVWVDRPSGRGVPQRASIERTVRRIRGLNQNFMVASSGSATIWGVVLLVICVSLFGLITSLLGYAILGEPYRPVFRRHRLRVPGNWPALSVVHISDLHVRRGDQR